MRDLFAVERHVQLMMVAHAYLELQRQDTLATTFVPVVGSQLVVAIDCKLKKFLK